MELYKWQNECLEKWKETGYRGIAEVTTGAGKTYMAGYGALNLRSIYADCLVVYIVVPRVALQEQWQRALKNIGINDSHIYQKGKQPWVKPQFEILTINTAREVLPLIIDKNMQENKKVLLILDEFHHYGSQVNNHLFDFLESENFRKENYFTLALSATTEVRTLKTKLIPKIGNIFYRYNLTSAISDEIVNPFLLFNIALQMSDEDRDVYDAISDAISTTYGRLYKAAPSLMKAGLPFAELIFELKNYPSDYVVSLAESLDRKIRERRDVMVRADDRIKATLKLIEYSSPLDKILVFTERIEQVETLNEKLASLGYKVGAYFSEMATKSKSRVLRDFKSGEKRILLCCKALDEGLDVPDCNVGIFLANTSTTLQRVQRVGRIIRKDENKKPSLLYYLYLEDTIEDCSMLYDLEDNTEVIEVRFRKNEFYNYEYMEKVKKLLSSINKEMTKVQKNDLAFLLKKGVIRPEQLLSREQLEKIINSGECREKAFIKAMIMLNR